MKEPETDEEKRRPKDYGLPPLTLQEAARVLGVPEGFFVEWLLRVVKPSDSDWSRWRNGVRDLPETLIRLYLTEGREAQSAWYKEFQELKEIGKRIEERHEEVQRAAAAVVRAARQRGRKAAGE